ncbi:MAG: hypothetical protein QW390_04160 [Candidatus Bathyarchaeia archaeon]
MPSRIMRSISSGSFESITDASAVISSLLGKTDRSVTVHLKGGTLEVKIGETVTMTGPVSKIFEGKLFEEALA